MARTLDWAVPLPRAVAEAYATAMTMTELAATQRVRSDGDATVDTQWWPEARCHLTLTHQRLSVSRADANRLAAIFYAAARLPFQPWYAQFRGGVMGADYPGPLPEGVRRACLATSVFDVSLPTPRAYVVACTNVEVDAQTRVIGVRSVVDGLTAPEPAVVAMLGAPSGDVFHHDGNVLHWHHILLAPGVGLGPDWFDRGLLRMLRTFGWDGAERATLRGEAEGLVRFVREHDLDAYCRAHDIEVD